MRALRRLCSACFGTLLVLAPGVQAQAPEHELKAAFVFNFVQFTQWPEGALSGSTLTLCVSPGTALQRALQTLDGKRVHERTLLVVPANAAAPGECQVVVSTAGDRQRLGTFKRLIGNGPVLSITDDSEQAHEGMLIALQVDAGRIVFSIDNTRASEAGLVLSSRLLRLARSVR